MSNHRLCFGGKTLRMFFTCFFKAHALYFLIILLLISTQSGAMQCQDLFSEQVRSSSSVFNSIKQRQDLVSKSVKTDGNNLVEQHGIENALKLFTKDLWPHIRAHLLEYHPIFFRNTYGDNAHTMDFSAEPLCKGAAKALQRILVDHGFPFLIHIYSTRMPVKNRGTHHMYLKLTNERDFENYIIVDPTFRQFFKAKVSALELSLIPDIFVGSKDEAYAYFKQHYGDEADSVWMSYEFTKLELRDPREPQ